MSVSPSGRKTNSSWLLIFGIVSAALLICMLTLAYVLIARPEPELQAAPPTATERPPGLRLPTAAVTEVVGPPQPAQELFIAQEPIKGFSDCNQYGFSGMVEDRNNQPLQDVQVVVWDDRAGLLALHAVDADGSYQIPLNSTVAQHRLWVQLFQNDVAVSQPVLVEPHIDCKTGFQIFQIDWQPTNP